MKLLVATLGGLLGAGAVVGLLASRKSRQLALRGAEIHKAFEGRGDALSLYLATKGEGAGVELEQMARQTAQEVAVERMATRFYIDQHQIELLGRLGRQLS